MLKNNKLLILTILLAILNLIAGCGGCSRSDTSNRIPNQGGRKKQIEIFIPNQTKDELSSHSSGNIVYDKLLLKHRSAIFKIFSSEMDVQFKGFGSFISLDGIAVTNFSVLGQNPSGNEIILTNNNQKLKIEKILSIDHDKDYIIFKVRINEKVRFTPIPFTDGRPEIGDDVFVIENTIDSKGSYSEGKIIGFSENFSKIYTTIKSSPNSNGSPILNIKGQIVGLNKPKIDKSNQNYAINIQELDLRAIFIDKSITFVSGHSYFVKITRVIDGDTFVIENGQRVRLIGMDCPEVNHPRKGKEPLGEETTEYVQELLEGKTVRLELDIGLYDPFNRLLAYVYIGDVFVNDLLLQKGLAQVTTFPPNVKYVEKFLESQESARNKRLGIWNLQTETEYFIP